MPAPFLWLAAGFLWLYLTKIPIAIAQTQQGSHYDNNNPRDQQAGLTGWGRRALAAHKNGFEIFPGFAAAVLVAQAAGADPHRTAMLAAIFVLSRVVYTALYLADLASLRSLVWSVGFFCTMGLFALPQIS